MDIAELRQKQSEAIGILKRFGTIEALDWLIDCSKSQNPDFKFAFSGYKSELKINRHISFQSGDSKYDLYLLNERTFPTYDSYATMGEFRCYFDSILVLDTNYHVNSDDWGTKRELSWAISRDSEIDGETITIPGSVRTIKLSDWVETLPEIVKKQKQEIENRSKKDQQERNKKEVSKTSGNFDLGKYK